MDVRSSTSARPQPSFTDGDSSNFQLSNQPLVFVDQHAAAELSQLESYRLTCQLFHCGLLDRTGTLEHGFTPHILDPLDELLGYEPGAASFDKLCRNRATEILVEATEIDRRVQVLWSGGIDSTVAAIALMQAATKMDCADRLQILCSVESVSEYSSFFHKYLWRQYEVMPVGYPVSSYLSPDALIVTGEHGDQLYGSDFLQPFVETGLAFEPWQDVLPFAFAAQSMCGNDAVAVREYLEPLMNACPQPIERLFDFFWWLNFSAKWQSVTMRIPANSTDPQLVYASTRHFFRHRDFQHWALFAHQRPRLASWRDYKMPSKQFIYEFTGDVAYRSTKEKERSLRLIFAGEHKRREKQPPEPAQSPEQSNSGSDFMLEGLALTSGFTPIWVCSA